MEREVWVRIVAKAEAIVKEQCGAHYTYHPREIALVYLWAALHERPTYWACARTNWPDEVRPAQLPVPSTMTRRLRTSAVQAVLQQLERRTRRRQRRSLLHIVDGKPLPIGNHSHDHDAGYGRGAGGQAKGYKLHVIAGKHGEIRAWCVRPIQHDEAKVAEQLLSAARLEGYLLGDANYDRNALYEACRRRGIQFLAPRRYGPRRGLGHHWHSPARLRAMELLELSMTGFGSQLMRERKLIERLFGCLSSSAFGLPSLPPWVRGLRRVERWICAKLIVWNCAKRVRTSAA